jgi:hypothetical protein
VRPMDLSIPKPNMRPGWLEQDVKETDMAILVPVYCAKCGIAFVFHGAPTPFCEKCR